MNLKPLFRAFLHTLIAWLALLAIVLVTASFYVPQVLGWTLRTFSPPLEPTPLPPTLLAPRGEMPAGVVGLAEWAQYKGRDYELVGSGFFLQLSGGTVIGVTTEHASAALGLPDNTLELIAFAQLPTKQDNPAFPKRREINQAAVKILQLDTQIFKF